MYPSELGSSLFVILICGWFLYLFVQICRSAEYANNITFVIFMIPFIVCILWQFWHCIRFIIHFVGLQLFGENVCGRVVGYEPAYRSSDRKFTAGKPFAIALVQVRSMQKDMVLRYNLGIYIRKFKLGEYVRVCRWRNVACVKPEL